MNNSNECEYLKKLHTKNKDEIFNKLGFYIYNLGKRRKIHF